jgi:hypothetical protein
MNEGRCPYELGSAECGYAGPLLGVVPCDKTFAMCAVRFKNEHRYPTIQIAMKLLVEDWMSKRTTDGPTLAACAAKFDNAEDASAPTYTFEVRRLTRHAQEQVDKLLRADIDEFKAKERKATALDKLREMAGDACGSVELSSNFNATEWLADSRFMGHDVEGRGPTLDAAIESLYARVESMRPKPASETIEQRIERIAREDGIRCDLSMIFTNPAKWRASTGHVGYSVNVVGATPSAALDALEAEIKRRAGK